MAVWKRSFLFWKHYFIQTMGMILVCGCVSVLVVGMRMGKYFSPGDMILELLSLMPVYWMIMGGILMVVQINMLYRCAVPLAIGMNSTRREALRGMDLMLAAVCAAVTLLTGILWAAVSGKDASGIAVQMQRYLPAMAGVYMIECGVGIVTGIVSFFWGKIGILMITVICGGFGAALGISLNVIEETPVKFADILGMIIHPWFGLGVGTCVFLAAVCLNHIAFRKMEVKL